MHNLQSFPYTAVFVTSCLYKCLVTDIYLLILKDISRKLDNFLYCLPENCARKVAECACMPKTINRLLMICFTIEHVKINTIQQSSVILQWLTPSISNDIPLLGIMLCWFTDKLVVHDASNGRSFASTLYYCNRKKFNSVYECAFTLTGNENASGTWL